MKIGCDDPRLAAFAPHGADRAGGAARLERFPRAVQERLAGQVGPLANLRSSAGCAWIISTDSPWIAVRLERLRHHQPLPCHIAIEVLDADRRHEALSEDLRERENAATVVLTTGLERGRQPGTVSIWLPPISTCALAGIELAEGSRAEAAVAPQARWLAIGDSLTQGFSVASPLQTWVHRLARRWHAPAHNLGVGGIRIEPTVFAPALAARSYDLVTIALGSNHAWHDSEADGAGARAAEARRHRREGRPPAHRVAAAALEALGGGQGAARVRRRAARRHRGASHRARAHLAAQRHPALRAAHQAARGPHAARPAAPP